MAAAHNPPQSLHPSLVARSRGQASALRPAAVAVHDDRQVARKLLRRGHTQAEVVLLLLLGSPGCTRVGLGAALPCQLRRRCSLRLSGRRTTSRWSTPTAACTVEHATLAAACIFGSTAVG